MRIDHARDVGRAVPEDELRDLDVDTGIVEARGAGVPSVVRKMLAGQELERL